MVLVGVAGMAAVGECITTHGCIPVGAIMILGTLDIMVTVTEVGTIPGGVIMATVMVVITAMAATTATAVDGTEEAVMETSGVTLFPETNVHCQTISGISFRTSVQDIWEPAVHLAVQHGQALRSPVTEQEVWKPVQLVDTVLPEIPVPTVRPLVTMVIRGFVVHTVLQLGAAMQHRPPDRVEAITIPMVRPDRLQPGLQPITTIPAPVPELLPIT
jgi:hypothetical protein